ncbi:MAG: hypothetical protein AAFU41_06470 [Pseudomonadota bacterium]
MISAAEVLTELYLSAAALAGLLILQWVLTRQDPFAPVNRRFLFCIRAVMLLFAGRILVSVTGVDAFRILVLLGAALIPLGVLLLTEGVLRRHAPAWIKTFMAAGAALFGITALWYSDSLDPARLAGLMGYQVIGLALSGWLIWARDRGSLTAQENLTVVRLGLTLILFVPLAAGDYLFSHLGLPVRLSALGVLVLCWLTIGLSRSRQRHRVTLVTLGLMVGVAAALGAVISMLTAGDAEGYILITALLLATLLLVVTASDARSLREEEQSLSLLRTLAETEAEDAQTFLQKLQDHPAVEGAVRVSDDALDALQMDVLQRIFVASPVVRKAPPPALGPEADDHIAYLFQRYAATHVMQVSRDPFTLIALHLPTLGGSDATEVELQLVQRMAMLMAERQGAVEHE